VVERQDKGCIVTRSLHREGFFFPR
jgi:hypothetical protein